MKVCQVSASSEKKNFEYFFENLPFMSPRQPIKLKVIFEGLNSVRS